MNYYQLLKKIYYFIIIAIYLEFSDKMKAKFSNDRFGFIGRCPPLGRCLYFILYLVFSASFPVFVIVDDVIDGPMGYPYPLIYTQVS